MSGVVATSSAATETAAFGDRRYGPGLYRLDLSPAKDLPLMANGEPTTFGVLLNKLVDSKVHELPDPFRRTDKYATGAGEIEVEGESDIRLMMRVLVDLVRREINPFEVLWFPYDHDWTGWDQHSHHFFAVSYDRIVSEKCSFFNGQPLILKQDKQDAGGWYSYPYFDEALALYWYPKFYEETITGKLMTLRPDRPELYYYERQNVKDEAENKKFTTLARMYHLLWWVIVVLLITISFPQIKIVSGIIAAALLIYVCVPLADLQVQIRRDHGSLLDKPPVP